jgi:excisionase family DNA binding protein
VEKAVFFAAQRAIGMNANTDSLLTEAQAAKLLGIKPRTVRAWRARNGLPYVKISAKTIRFLDSDIRVWLQRRRVAISA